MEYMSYATPNILIVDDIHANLVVLTEMIRNIGYIARPVTSAMQAQYAIDTLLPNMILLDVSMPDMDGFEFCEMLKKDSRTKDIPVIFISALNQAENRIKGLKVGAVDYITKPFEVEEAALRINQHIKNQKVHHQLEMHNKKLYRIMNEQIRNIYEEQKKIIHSILKLYTNRDISKNHRIDRVGANARLLTTGMQISTKYQDVITNSFIEAIEYAAPLHDIGDIGINPARYENMPEEEREALYDKEHTILGAETLQQIYSYNEHSDFAKMSIEVAKYHHAYWDGTGYPFGVAKEDIPLSARIVSIIDYYDEWLMKYPENLDFAHDMAMKEIKEAAGIRFDPDIVMIFQKIQNQLKRE